MDVGEDNSLTPADSTLPVSDARFFDIPLVRHAGEDGALKRIRRRKLVFVSAFTLTILLVGVVYFAETPVYRATASIVIAPPDRVLSAQETSDTQVTIGDIADLESQSVILSSSTIARDFLNQSEAQQAMLDECEARRAPSWQNTIKHSAEALMGLGSNLKCAAELTDVTDAVARLREHLSVGVNGRSRVIDVTFTSQLPAVAQTVANGIVTSYLRSELKAKLQPRDAAIEWLRAQSQVVASRLKTTELQIQSYLQKKGVVSGQRGPIASEQLTNLSEQLARAQADRAAAAGRMQQTIAGSNAVGSIIDSHIITDVKQQLTAVKANLAQASAVYGPAAPQVRSLEGQRRSLEVILAQETNVANGGASADYRAANDRVENLSVQVEQLKGSVHLNDDATMQVASLQRDAATDRDLFIDITRSLNKLETDRRLVISNAHLVNLAELPEKVFFPRLSSFALAGALLAFTIASLSALIRDRADKTFKSARDLHDYRLQVLAYLPHISWIGRSPGRIMRQIQSSYDFQEAIRRLYAECLLLSARSLGARPRSIMITSADAGEGKTTVVIAFGVLSVAAGLRVLIIECELRRPSIAQSLSLGARPGLSEVLCSDSQLSEAVSSVQPGLDVIAAGSPTSRSSELLGSGKFRQVLSWAEANYDLVLIDAPGSRSAPDARILAGKVDGVIYCVHWGHSGTNSVTTGIAGLRAAGGKVIGLVVNQVGRSNYKLLDRTTIPSGISPLGLQASQS